MLQKLINYYKVMKTYIWVLPTRLFHWMLAVGFAVAYLLGDSDKILNLHFAFGAFVGILLIFRLLFGLIGPKYSNFRDFPIGIGNQIEFIKTFFAGQKVYAGHNPSAALVMLSIFIVGIVCSTSGYLIYATENNIFNLGFSEDFLEETHEILANLFLMLVAFHLLGILTDTVFHGKTGTLQSIFTGYKNINADNAKLNGFQKIFAIFWFIIPLIFSYFAHNFTLNSKENIKNQSEQHEKNEEAEEHDNEEDDD